MFRVFFVPYGYGYGCHFQILGSTMIHLIFRYHEISQKSVIFGWIQHKNGSMFYSFFRNKDSTHFNPFHLCQGTLRTSATSSMRGSHCAVAPWQSGLCPRRGWNESWIKLDHWDLGFQHMNKLTWSIAYTAHTNAHTIDIYRPHIDHKMCMGLYDF